MYHTLKGPELNDRRQDDGRNFPPVRHTKPLGYVRVSPPAPRGNWVAPTRLPLQVSPIRIAAKPVATGSPIIRPQPAKPRAVIPRIVNTPKPLTPATPTAAQTAASTLQTAINTLLTNPSNLTAAEFAELQASGQIANTLPYSEASDIALPGGASGQNTASVNDPNCLAEGEFGGPYPNCTSSDPQCAAEGMTGGPYPNCTAASSTSLSSLLPAGVSLTDVSTWPWYFWAVGAGGIYLLFFQGGKKGRKR